MTHEYISPNSLAQRIQELSLKNNLILNDRGLMITFDDEAIKNAKRLFLETQVETRKPQLRVYIEGKGCDGFFYGVAFDSPQENDFICVYPELDVIVDPNSLLYIYGSTVTWMKHEGKEGFCVENPNHSRFRGKFYKKSAWRDVLEATK